LTESVTGLPAPLSGIVERCLEKNPQQRFQSARDLAFALQSLPATAAPSLEDKSRGADDRPSVAVLPFANLSADPEQEFFCDGMAEEIINALAQVQGLRVVARTSAFSFKGKQVDIREIGSRLDVGAIVEGSVRKAGERLRITAQLIDVRDGSHLWSERFDRHLEDVFEIQDEIALAVVEKLEVKLLGKERAAVVKRPTADLDAYEAYLKAWYHWNELTPEGYLRSRECFEEAIRIDPDFVGAYVGLSIWYLSQSWWAELSTEDAMAAAMPLGERALRLDDSSPEAHLFLANARFFERKWAMSEKSFLKAVELAPNAAEVHGGYAALLLVRRRFDEALAEVRLAQKLDPLSPTWNTWTCSWIALAGKREEGTVALESVAAKHPNHWLPHHFLSVLYALASRLEEAKAEGERAVELSGGISATVTQLACLCYQLNDMTRANELFDKLRQRARASYVPPTFLAWIHLARGETDDALELLQEAARGKDPWLNFHRFQSPAPHLEDPRFDSLLEGLGL
jgi:serine/threonine-protein kinase